jgi:hypothetical protein
VTPPVRPTAAATRSVLRAAFATVIAVVLAAQLLDYFTTRGIERDVDQVFSNSLRSIRLLGHIGLQTERWRILIDRHILQQDPTQMESLDSQISATRKAWLDSARAYAGDRSLGRSVVAPFESWRGDNRPLHSSTRGDGMIDLSRRLGARCSGRSFPASRGYRTVCRGTRQHRHP